MRVITFASGSTGNCSLVSAGGEHILIDAGISMKRILSCLASEGIPPGEISGVFITHEHSDHVSGLDMLVRHFNIPVFAPGTVASRLSGLYPDIREFLSIIHTSEPFALGGMSVTAFHTMHDTPESVGYRFDAEASFGYCTDLGCVTDEVRNALSGVDAAIVEANHDEEMLRCGSYPVFLKRRILSERGHLSNDCGAALAAFLAENGAGTIILGHLSRENNTPDKAYGVAAQTLADAGLSPELFVAPAAGRLSVEVNAHARRDAYLRRQDA